MTLSTTPLANGGERIHFAIADPKGPAKTKPRLIGKIHCGGASYRLACDSAWSDLSKCRHSGVCQAVTCPECVATSEWRDAMAYQGEVLAIQS
jgi:hypothetical protein